jgi:hypothetical protein
MPLLEALLPLGVSMPRAEVAFGHAIGRVEPPPCTARALQFAGHRNQGMNLCDGESGSRVPPGHDSRILQRK